MNPKKLSIIVIFHNMRREAARTLYALSSAHQAGVRDQAYEVIAIDNGSFEPLDEKQVTAFGPNFRYHFFDTASPSPVAAVNHGVALATGHNIAVIVDGARMASPGLIATSLKGLRLFPEPFVYGLSWHLGPEIQNLSLLKGYDQAEEDRLLDQINWKKNGYGLFKISTIAPSSRQGFLGGVPPECSWLAMRRESFLTLGGFEPRFQAPGGGLVNHDFRNRAMALPRVRPVGLLGEGVFHQFHGGVATNVKKQEHPMARFQAEYADIRGEPLNIAPTAKPFLIGTLRPAALPFLDPLSSKG